MIQANFLQKVLMSQNKLLKKTYKFKRQILYKINLISNQQIDIS